MSRSKRERQPLSGMRSSALCAALLALTLTACANPFVRPKGTTYYVDEQGHVTTDANAPEIPSPSPNAPPPLPIAPEPVIINAADLEGRNTTPASSSPPPSTNFSNITTVTYTYEMRTNTTRYFFTLLPDPYTSDPDLQPPHIWQPSDGYCGERFNLMDPNQRHSEKIPKVALYSKIECVFRCAADNYLAQVYPLNSSMMVYKNFTINKPCDITCLGRQVGWSC